MGEKTVMFLLFIHISCVGESKRKEVKLKEAVNLKDSYSMFSKIKGYWALRFDKLQESDWEIHGGNWWEIDANFIRFAYVGSSQPPFSTSGNKSHCLSGLEEESTGIGEVHALLLDRKGEVRVLPASVDFQFLSVQNHPYAKAACFDTARPAVLH